MLSKIIDEHLVHEAARLIDRSSHIVITCHMGPDGDAIGSSLAMLHFLQSLEKDDVHVIVPNTYPDFLAWMPQAGQIINYESQTEQADQLISRADLIVCLDFNTLKRLGKMSEAVSRSTACRMLIDHHIDPQIQAEVAISYPLLAATCELVFRLICRMGCFEQMNKSIAECIYTGLMTDTGNFSYNSSNPELYTIVAELLTFGIDKDQIYQHVFHTYSADRMRLMGYCMYSKMKYLPRYHTAVIALNATELRRFHFQSGDAEGIVNLPLQIRDVTFSILMREDKEKIKISLRSQGDFAVNDIAARLFSGGGHKNAAGGESYDSLEATVKRLMDALPEICPK
ncbi:MAG: DHH family phosphoesterase [Paludibacteraceae bacterium]|nr:DHH family phosphoesterase [Paludibacteraceae bacterium]